MRRQKAMERKEEPGHARRHGAHQKEHSPAVEPFPGKQPEHDDESREDPNQAQHHAHKGACRDA